MAKPTLAKDSKTVKFPHQSGSVIGAFERALAKSKEQKWTKVIIIGESTSGGHWFHSRMGTHTVTGMIEDMKYNMNKDFYG